MSITRRDVLAAAVGCGLTTTTAGADEKPAADQPKSDPIFRGLPDAVRKAFEDTLPGYWCVRLATRGEKDAAVYRATVFHPAHGQSARVIDGESVTTPRLYDVALDSRGKSLEETARPIVPDQLPKAVVAAYEKWNPKGVKRMATMWSTELPRGKERVY